MTRAQKIEAIADVLIYVVEKSIDWEGCEKIAKQILESIEPIE